MKRIVIVALLIAAVLPLNASQVVLSPDGEMFALATTADGLVVTVTRDGETVEETTIAGAAGEAAMVFDSTSRSFLLAYTSGGDVLLSAYRDGSWGRPRQVVEDRGSVSRIRLAITQQAEPEDGESGAATSVHLFWWETNARFDGARYALADIEDGELTDFREHDLRDLANAGDTPGDRVVRQIMLLESAERDMVDVLFAHGGSLYRVRLKPIADHRVRIPIGVRPRMHQVPDLRGFSDAHAVSSGDDDIVIFVADRRMIRYVISDGAKWSVAREVRLAEAAAKADPLMRKMVAHR